MSSLDKNDNKIDAKPSHLRDNEGKYSIGANRGPLAGDQGTDNNKISLPP